MNAQGKPPVNWTKVQDRFSVPKRSGIYVLGCFARHLTLYSQQVRALNLVASLCHTGELKGGTPVAVIGGGAAGLLAAAAAAYRGASVTMFEQLEDPMELQRNNRQRWLHPRIYDWPQKGWDNPKADLPLITWSAGYAESVALQIESYWKQLERNLGITAKFRTTVQISEPKDGLLLIWDEPDPPSRRASFHIVILAVGFGLEPEKDPQRSYWDEDDIDGSFRKPTDKPKKWLVSGCGDGGLTDLMRLCLRRFRHEDVVRLFAKDPGIEGAIKELQRIHADTRAEDAQFLSREYENLKVEGWSRRLRESLRRDGAKIFLAAQSPYYYGSGASVLNRLIVSQLFQIGAFTYRLGPTKRIKRNPKGGYDVVFASGRPEHFDRVIVRYGPKPTALEDSFSQIAEACEDKCLEWHNLKRDDDETIIPLWDVGFFGPEPAPPLVDETRSPSSFAGAAGRLGVRANSLSVRKEVRSDGSSSMTYRIEGLMVTDPLLHLAGFRFYIWSNTGCVGEPELDAAAERMGLRWQARSEEEPLRPLAQAREEVKQLYRILEFPRSLQKGDQPLSFGFTLKLLNADALSQWEFVHLYDEASRTHFNGDPLDPADQDAPIEYFARVIWFPVETLEMQLTLPDRIPAPPSVGFFTCEDADRIPRDQVVGESILECFPAPGTVWHPPEGEKKWVRRQDAIEASLGVIEIAPQTWQLTVHMPPTGSCYSLDWRLASYEGDPEFRKLENEAEAFRQRFLHHRRQRLLRQHGDTLIREEFHRLEEALRSLFEPAPAEGFEVSLMVYDGLDRRLEVVEGSMDGADLPASVFEDFWLPFGLGLAGACFKEGERAFLYVHPDKPAPGPEYYLPLRENYQHDVLLAVPIYHPGFAAYIATKTLGSKGPERSRQCIGVFDIGSRYTNQKLRELRNHPEPVNELIRPLCQTFCNRVVSSN